MSAAATKLVSIEDIRRVARAALANAGCDAENAASVAAVMAAADRDGCASHGLFRLAGYLAALKSGKVDGRARPSLERLAPSVVRIDGHGGFAPLAMERAREALSSLAPEQGIAAAALVDVHHFSALWVDIEPLVQAGLAAMCFTAYMPAVAPYGGRKPFFGTNPMAFGWPRADGRAMIFDQASAAMARGDITIAARDGRALPPGIGIDASGEPATDPAAVLKGAQLPFGGYKGTSIALMVELLAAGLIGQPFSVEAGEQDSKDGGPPRGGVFLLALDPAKFGDAQGWLAHCEAFFARYAALDGVRLPGDRRSANRARIARDGARMPARLWDDALKAAGEAA
ncbi:MAG TPA: Ldh family oxidoreductase [Burkholderiales bacterium]|nr:Ldh family oxidoreductase [Burkholderiales bacterium]